MIHVQNEDSFQRFGEDWIHIVSLCWEAKHHMQDVF